MSVAVGTGRRAARWADFASQTSDRFSTRFEFQPFGAEACAPQMEFHSGDGVAVSKGVMPALRLTNHGSSWPDPYFQIVRTDQESVLAMEGHGTMRLAPGELVVCRPEIAGEWTIERSYTTVALHMDETLLRRYAPDPMALVGARLDVPEPLHDILVRIMDAAVELSHQGRFAAAGRSLACSFLHMLALTPRVAAPDDRVERYALEFRRVQIKTFIQKNYAKPGLSTEDIANHLQITTRYVQKALADEGLTPSEYLRICRLEAARRLLSSSAATDRSITEIAFECGFTSSAHFSTEFRKRFGRSPRSYRQAAPALRAARES